MCVYTYMHIYIYIHINGAPRELRTCVVIYYILAIWYRIHYEHSIHDTCTAYCIVLHSICYRNTTNEPTYLRLGIVLYIAACRSDGAPTRHGIFAWLPPCTYWVAPLVQRDLSVTASFVFYGSTCLRRLISYMVRPFWRTGDLDKWCWTSGSPRLQVQTPRLNFGIRLWRASCLRSEWGLVQYYC